MSVLPALKCPKCRGALEYHVTLEMINPPIGKIDTGYCPACARLFECLRDSGSTYESTAWPPVCRQCRQPVSFVNLRTGDDQEEHLLYRCRQHPSEEWHLTRGTDVWSR